MRFGAGTIFPPASRICALVCAVACLLSGCSSARKRPPLPAGQTSFAAYQDDARAWLAANRAFQTANRPEEIEWNGPQEWRPALPADERPRGGVLLVHGLGDSPFSVSEIGAELSRRGWLVRTLLLPGHGGEPADLLNARAKDWRRLVAAQAKIIEADTGAGPVFLGGFSMGANLALVVAADDPRVAGLLLFSPAFESRTSYDWAARWVAPFKPWLRKPVPGVAQQTPVRYSNVPTNGFAQFYKTSKWARSVLAGRGYAKPVLIVAAERDSVVNVQRVAEFFVNGIKHPESRLIWYGANPPGTADARVIVRTDYLPEQRISNFSHMGVLYSPKNPQYGIHGSLPPLRVGRGDDVVWRIAAGEPVWYSAWGYSEPGKVHMRLTFNPYFDWQMDMAEEVMCAAR